MNASKAISVLPVAALVAAGLLFNSCDQNEEKIFDNPHDANGQAWSPPFLEILTPKVVAGINDTFEIRALVSDPDPADRIDSVFWNFGELRSRSIRPGKDTAVLRAALRTPGTYPVLGWARDGNGVSSPQVGLTVVIEARPPVVDSIGAPSDSVEPGKSVQLEIFARDSLAPGAIKRYFWQAGGNGKVETTTVAKRSFVPPTEGEYLVRGWVADDDSILSTDRTRTLIVASRRPTATLVAPDSAEINREFTLVAGGSDIAPGKVVQWQWTVGTTLDTTTVGSRKVKRSVAGVVPVSVRAIDDDGNLSKAAVAANVRVLAHAPVLASSAPDTTRTAVKSATTLVFTATDAPTDPKGDSLLFRWTTSTGASGTGRSVKIEDTTARVVRIEMVAVDKDSLASAPLVRWVRVLPRAPRITTPASSSLVTDTTLAIAWDECFHDSIFEVRLDTLPVPRRVASKSSLRTATVAIPTWNRSWYLQVVGRRRGDSAASEVIKLDVSENPGARALLKNLRVLPTATGTAYTLDTAFSSVDTQYVVDVEPSMTSLVVNALANDVGQKLVFDGGAAVTSVAAGNSATIPLVSNPQVVRVQVVSTNGARTRTYQVLVRRDYPEALKLTSITLGAGGTLSPAFHKDSSRYVVSIPKGDSLSLAWTTSNPIASVVIKRAGAVSTARVLRGDAVDTAGVKLEVSTNLGYVNSIVIKVELLPSRNTRLSGLEWSTDLVANRSFHPDSLVYDLRSAVGDSQITVRPSTTSGEGQTLTVQGTAVASGAVRTIPITRGPNLVEVVVTAADRTTTRTYRLYVTRPTATDARLDSLVPSPGTTVETDTVRRIVRVTMPFGRDSARFRVVPASRLGSVRLDGAALASGTWSAWRRLLPGDSSSHAVEILAEDTSSRQAWTVRLLRQKPDTFCALSGLELGSLSGVSLVAPFDSTVLDLRGFVPYSDTVLGVAPRWSGTIRSVTVEARKATSGLELGGFSLKAEDTTVLNVVVTAQDSTKSRTYRVAVFRGAPNRNVDLASLELTAPGGRALVLSPVFATADTLYQLDVPFQDSTVVVAPVGAEALQRRILVNGTVVVSGGTSGALALKAADTTTIRVVVVAQDTTLRRTYEVKVFRAAARRNAALVRFGQSVGTLDQSPDTSVATYVLSVPNATTSVTISPVAADSAAASVKSSATSVAGLQVGVAKSVIVTVTAQDTSVRKVYTLNIVREKDASELPDVISADTILTLAKGPYKAGDFGVTINPGVRVTIEPGVTIRLGKSFTGAPVNFKVQGTLIARGTPTSPITFTAQNGVQGEWGFLMFDDSAKDARLEGAGNWLDGSILENVVVELGGGYTTVGNNANLIISASAPYLNRVTVRNSRTKGVLVKSNDNQPLVVDRVTVQDNTQDGWDGTSIDFNDGSRFRYCRALRNGGSGFANLGSGVFVLNSLAQDNLESGFEGIQLGNLVRDSAIGNDTWGFQASQTEADSLFIVGNGKGRARGTGGGAALRTHPANGNCGDGAGQNLKNSKFLENGGTVLHNDRACGAGVLNVYKTNFSNNSSDMGIFGYIALDSVQVIGNTANMLIDVSVSPDGGVWKNLLIRKNKVLIGGQTPYNTISGGLMFNGNIWNDKTSSFSSNVIDSNTFGGHGISLMVATTTDNLFQDNVAVGAFMDHHSTNLNNLAGVTVSRNQYIRNQTRDSSLIVLSGSYAGYNGAPTDGVQFTSNTLKGNVVERARGGSILVMAGWDFLGRPKHNLSGNNITDHLSDYTQNFYVIRNDMPANQDATTPTPTHLAKGNWWGTSSASALLRMKLDNTADGNRGSIDMSSPLTSPSLTAPAVP